MNKEEMINAVIEMRGFEDEMTIWFCEMCKKPNMNNKELCVAFKLVIEYPIYEDEKLDANNFYEFLKDKITKKSEKKF